MADHERVSLRKQIGDNVVTQESITKAYIKLSRIHHPDLGGNNEQMQSLNSQREEMLKQILATESKKTISNRPVNPINSKIQNIDISLASILKSAFNKLIPKRQLTQREKLDLEDHHRRVQSELARQTRKAAQEFRNKQK